MGEEEEQSRAEQSLVVVLLFTRKWGKRLTDSGFSSGRNFAKVGIFFPFFLG